MIHHPMLIILAGGASSRLWPLNDKSLLKIAPDSGRLLTLIERHLATFAALGFEEAVVIANPDNAGALQEATRQVGLRVTIAIQPEPAGMGDAILRAEDHLEARRYPPIYITMAHDVVDDTLHHRMLEAYRSDKAASYLAGYRVSDYFPGGYLTVTAEDQISGIIEKPGAGNEPSDLVNLVAHLHTEPRPLLAKIRRLYEEGHPTDDHYEHAMGQMMGQTRYQAVRYDGPWSAVKYPWHVLDVMQFFLGQIDGQHIHPEAKVAESAMIAGDVIVEAGARVFHGASIVGPAYIGAGSIVGNGALVRESMVGAGCAVGHVSEVARSYLADGCQLHRAVVLDSVFDENVNFSAGCITANLRWDRGIVKSTVKGARMETGRDKFGAAIGRDAFIGIQSGTMPGVKIGQRAVAGPFTNVTQDIPDATLFYAQQQTVEKGL